MTSLAVPTEGFICGLDWGRWLFGPRNPWQAPPHRIGCGLLDYSDMGLQPRPTSQPPCRPTWFRSHTSTKSFNYWWHIRRGSHAFLAVLRIPWGPFTSRFASLSFVTTTWIFIIFYSCRSEDGRPRVKLNLKPNSPKQRAWNPPSLSICFAPRASRSALSASQLLANFISKVCNKWFREESNWVGSSYHPSHRPSDRLEKVGWLGLCMPSTRVHVLHHPVSKYTASLQISIWRPAHPSSFSFEDHCCIFPLPILHLLTSHCRYYRASLSLFIRVSHGSKRPCMIWRRCYQTCYLCYDFLLHLLWIGGMMVSLEATRATASRWRSA